MVSLTPTYVPIALEAMAIAPFTKYTKYSKYTTIRNVVTMLIKVCGVLGMEEKQMKDVMENVSVYGIHGTCIHVKNEKYEVTVQNDGEHQWISIKQLSNGFEKVFVYSCGDIEVNGKKVKR